MAIIDKRFVYFQNKEEFNSHYQESTDGGNTYGDLLGTSLVFIESTQEIWTHGEVYKCDINTEKVQELLNSHTFDASKIISGTIDIARLPKGALERLVPVANESARFKLTSNDVQEGDTVKELDTGLMYLVVDVTNLDNSAGYEIYTAGSAASVPWSGVTSKPTFVTRNISLNNISYDVWSTSSNIIPSIYAPKTAGTSGQILKSSGNDEAPVWINPSELSVGSASSVSWSNITDKPDFLSLGETSTTAYAGDKGKLNKDILDSLGLTNISDIDNSIGTNAVSRDSDQIRINLIKKSRSSTSNPFGSGESINIPIPSASAEKAGVMSAADKAKLDSINIGNYLPLSGGAMTGRVSVVNDKGTFEYGKGSAAIMFNGMNNIDDSNWHCFLGIKSNIGGTLSFGGLNNTLGFIGYFADRVQNGYDFGFRVNMTTGVWNVENSSNGEALTINNKPVATKEWSNSQFLKLSGGTLTGTLTGTEILLPYTKSTYDGSNNNLGSIPISGTLVGTNLNTDAPNYRSFIGGYYKDNSWYHLLSIRHRNGRNDGDNYDGSRYGMVIVANYNPNINDSNLTWRRQYAETWEDTRTIYDSKNLIAATTTTNGLMSSIDKDLLENKVQKSYTYEIDASALDPNTYYPVTYKSKFLVSARDRFVFEVYSELNMAVAPWGEYIPSNGKGSYSCYIRWRDTPDGWGSVNSGRERIVEVSTYRHCTSLPIQNIGQLTYSSEYYFFVRGGGKYKFRATGLYMDSSNLPVLHSETYTTPEGQSISPTTKQLNTGTLMNSTMTNYQYWENTTEGTIYPGYDVRIGTCNGVLSLTVSVGTNYRYPYSADAFLMVSKNGLTGVKWNYGTDVATIVCSEDAKDPTVNLTSNPNYDFIVFTIHFQPVTDFSVDNKQSFNAIINAAGYKRI